MTFETIALIITFVIGGYVAWNIGANDVANAIGTSVGSKALTVKQAILIAAIFEVAGAILVGSHVTDTMRKNIIDTQLFKYEPEQVIYGMLAALIATGLFLHSATFFGLPVSTTHSIVGAIVGFGIISMGLDSISWNKILQIVISWITSPLLGGIVAYLLFHLISRTILDTPTPIYKLKMIAPVLVFLVIFIITLSIIYQGLSNLHLDLPFWLAFLIALGCGLIASIISRILLKRIPKTLSQVSSIQRIKVIENTFKVLLILTSCFIAFAHGSNDVANAIGPMAAIIDIINSHQISKSVSVPFWLLVFGGGFIVVGLLMYGYKVIQTVGQSITEMTPTRAFIAQFSAASVILIGSKLGIPLSTTHVLVGSIIGIGMARGIYAINMRVVRNILSSWLITLPVAALVTIIIYLIIKHVMANIVF